MASSKPTQQSEDKSFRRHRAAVCSPNLQQTHHGYTQQPSTKQVLVRSISVMCSFERLSCTLNPCSEPTPVHIPSSLKPSAPWCPSLSRNSAVPAAYTGPFPGTVPDASFCPFPAPRFCFMLSLLVCFFVLVFFCFPSNSDHPLLVLCAATLTI